MDVVGDEVRAPLFGEPEVQGPGENPDAEGTGASSISRKASGPIPPWISSIETTSPERVVVPRYTLCASSETRGPSSR